MHWKKYTWETFLAKQKPKISPFPMPGTHFRQREPKSKDQGVLKLPQSPEWPIPKAAWLWGLRPTRRNWPREETAFLDRLPALLWPLLDLGDGESHRIKGPGQVRSLEQECVSGHFFLFFFFLLSWMNKTLAIEGSTEQGSVGTVPGRRPRDFCHSWACYHSSLLISLFLLLQLILSS